MKKLLIILSLFLSQCLSATTYYVSVAGNGTNNGTSASTTWDLAKLNSAFNRLIAGDNVLLNRGDIFYGTLTVNKSGASGSPIIIGTYGTGSNPVITGFTNVTAWTNLGSNIWESSSAVSTLSTCNIVVINGVNTAMGRTPNSGYYSYQIAVSNTSITSSSVTGTPNWTGAELVIRKKRWILDRNTVTSQSGGTLNYSGGGYNGKANFGFFIQNDVRTLDQQNEWYYNPSTKKIRIYSTASPTEVQVSTLDTLLYINGRTYITVNGVDFTGANKYAANVRGSDYISIINSNISFCVNGVVGTNVGTHSYSFIFTNNTVTNCTNKGIDLPSEFDHSQISYNSFKNNGMLLGAGNSGDGTYEDLNIYGVGAQVMYNRCDSTGYASLSTNDDSINVSYNYVTNYCLLKDDGAAIYQGNNHHGDIVSYNTIINGIGNNAGLPSGYFSSETYGIYEDGNSSSGYNIFNNNISNPGYAGIYLHNSHDITVTGNTIYNPRLYGLFINNDVNSAGSYTTGLLIKNNKIVVKASATEGITTYAVALKTENNGATSTGTLDSNYYAKPIDDNITMQVTWYGNWDNYYTIAQWKTYMGQDAHSNKSPLTISNINDLRFEYNATSSPVTISLPYNYIDVRGIPYNRTITLAPYTSAVLMKN